MIFRVIVVWEDKEENLGILVPEGGWFQLNVRIPAVKAGKGRPVFRIVPRRGTADDRFVPISPETPFAYLHRLEDAYLQVRNGQMGIVLKEKSDPLL